MVGIAVLATVAFILVELKAAEPLIPLTLFRDRTFTLAVLASISIGVAMFGTSVYLAQYMQISRGYGPTEAGLLTIPMAAGMLIASTVVGQLITRTGRWKGYLVAGAVLMVAGTALLSTLDYQTSLWLVGVYMFLLGAGTGMTMNNLVLVVQNTSRPEQIGVASSGVNFFRTVGGTAGVAVMGSVLASSFAQQLTDRAREVGSAIEALGAKGAVIAEQLAAGSLPTTRDMPESVRVIVEDVSAQAISHAFLIGVPLAVLSLVTVLFIPNLPLATKNTVERLREQRAEGRLAVATAETGSIPLPRIDATDADSSGPGRR